MHEMSKGPYTIERGDVVLAEIEEVSVDYAVESNTVTSVQGRTKTVSGAHSVTVDTTFLETDIAALKAVLPQYWVANGGEMSTGETVNDPNGAIDIVPGASFSDKEGLIVTSANGHVMRVVDTTTEIAGVTLGDDGVRRVTIRHTGETNATTATIQFFKEGALGAIS